MVAWFVELERRVQDRLAKWSPAGESLEQILTAFLRFQFRLKQPDYKFVRIFFTQMFARSEQMYPYIVEVQKIIDPPLIRFLASLQERGLIRRDIAMESLVLHFKTVHFGLSAVWALEGPPWHGTARALPMQVRLLCRGIEAGNA